MLHWNPASDVDELFYNDVVDGELTSVGLEIASGRKRTLPGPLSGLSPNGRWALSLTYGRMGRLRRVVGYAAAEDPYPNDPAPQQDGVFLIDLRTGEKRLIVSIADIYARLLPDFPDLSGRHMWFNHTAFNRSGDRFAFFARAYLPPGQRRHTAMFTAGRDGDDIRQVVAFDKRPSHYDWRNDREILATFVLHGADRQHVLFTDGGDDYRVVGAGALDFDGHCAIAPDGDWVVTDRKHLETVEQSLWLFNLKTRALQQVCRHDMRHPRYLSWNVRCDFHPRFSRDGRQVSFDAIEHAGGTRQLHVYDRSDA